MILVLPFPPSANAYWRAAPKRGLVPSDEATRYKREVARVTAVPLPFKGPVSVRVLAFRPRKSGDLDNVLKVLFDALSGIAWLDDEQVEAIDAKRFDDCSNPRVQVEVMGGMFATAAEVAAHRQAKTDAKKKRRKTLAINRAAKRAAALRLSPAYRAARGGR